MPTKPEKVKPAASTTGTVPSVKNTAHSSGVFFFGSVMPTMARVVYCGGLSECDVLTAQPTGGSPWRSARRGQLRLGAPCHFRLIVDLWGDGLGDTVISRCPPRPRCFHIQPVRHRKHFQPPPPTPTHYPACRRRLLLLVLLLPLTF